MHSKMPSHLLTEGAKNLGLQMSDEITSHLITYIEELLRWSPKIDLISQTDPTEVIRKHILDALAVVPHIPEGAAVLDLGSGAGLPGIPLAILLTKSPITLLEARRKRVSFLKTVARDLQLGNLSICEGRAEILAQEHSLHQAFDVAVTRATWDTKQFLHFAIPFLQRSGLAIIMKGPGNPKEHLREELEKCPGFRLKEQRDYSLPFGEEKRKLLIFVKSEA
jgi:16S rRNA (guanine527-N7)-methyltransferase